MIIAVASGKGGTGKTTVALSMAKLLGSGAVLLDCDVEEPNAHLFLPGEMTHVRTVCIRVPKVDPNRCDGCGRCADLCQYGAIISIPSGAQAFSELCHGCGGCAKVCPNGAIQEVDWRIGVIEEANRRGIHLIHGRLDVGMPMATPLIRAVRDSEREGNPVIIDAPPGTACSAAAAITGADYAILVTEPTRFGLHDFKLAVDLVRHLGIPFGAVINRAGDEDAGVRRFCADLEINVLSEIPDDRSVAEAYSRGRIPADVNREYADRIRQFMMLIPGLEPSEHSQVRGTSCKAQTDADPPHSTKPNHDHALHEQRGSEAPQS